jgi:hypothetical protein
VRIISRRNRSFNPNNELASILIKSGFLDKALLEHLSSIIRTCGPSGLLFKTDWPTAQTIRVHKACIELVDKWFPGSTKDSINSTLNFSNDLKQSIQELTEVLGLTKLEHPYETPIILSTGDLLSQKADSLNKEQIIALLEIGLTIIIGMKWFPGWSEENKESISNRLSFLNLGALNVHKHAIESVLKSNEVALNAGTSYMLNQGNYGDGTLVATNQRLIFVFEQDFNKQPFPIEFQNIASHLFTETSVVPISKEMTIHFNENGFIREAKFIVGNYFSVELTNLFQI